jgi:hypothetical protein
MPRSATSRIVLLLVLSLLLAVSTLQAAAPRTGDEPVRTAPAAWDLLAQVWDFLTGVWSANGCEFDPDGRCRPAPPTVQTDNGCEFDPSGRCRG